MPNAIQGYRRQGRNQVKTTVDLHSAADGRVLLQEIIGPGGFQSCEQIKEKDESPKATASTRSSPNLGANRAARLTIDL
jgi:hypothetical protein